MTVAPEFSDPGVERERPAFSCALTAVLIARVGRIAGPNGPARLLSHAASPRSLEYLLDIGQWVTYAEAVALWEAGMMLTGDPHFARRVGEDFVAHLAGSATSSALRSLGSPEALLQAIARAGHRFSTAADLEPIEVRPGYAEVRAVATPGFTRHRHHCEWTAGLLTQVTVLFGLPPAVVEHDGCQALGGATCGYRVSWNVDRFPGADADAGGEAAALRAQLEAVSSRLQSMFDIAADLIAPSDLDRTLARITDRAAEQVRVPRYLLAVRTAPEADLHVHQKGFADAEARALADQALAGGEHPEHWLLAPVCSHRHDYGVLIAVHERETGFFEHERRLLEVYARYAATALDGATALSEAHTRRAEAQRRDDESRTLLELARRLARAGSSEQVAQRLADAVPGVVDCDRVSVYVWHPDEGELVRESVNVGPGAGDASMGLERIAPDDVPQLAQWLREPDSPPVFIDLKTSPIRESLREFGARAAVAVPIATESRLLGSLIVSVVSRPRRLAPSKELVDRLSGVAAQAATALENGRLVDHITHQARHDVLTGAANRVGFQERLAAAATRPDGRLALFYIDLDRFKPINDQYGHEVGDALLREIARRLERCVRTGDTVARLGGDEFAVLAEGSADDAGLTALATRLAQAFEAPFPIGGRRLVVGASIGRALREHGGEGPEELLRRADAAMYAAKRAASAAEPSRHASSPAA